MGSAALASVSLLAVAQTGACSHDWGALEPLDTSSSSGPGSTDGSTVHASGSGGATGTGGHGGGTSAIATGSGGGSITATIGSSSSASSGTGGSGPTHCGGMSLLSIDFSTDPTDVVTHDTNFKLDAGDGRIDVPSALTTYFTSVVGSLRAYDLTGDQLSLRVDEVPSVASSAFAQLEVAYDGGERVYLRKLGGNLVCGSLQGSNNASSSKPYLASTAAYWRLREDQGTIHCEISPDDVAWSEVGHVDLLSAGIPLATHVRADLRVESPGGVNSGGTFRFGALNGGQGPKGSWCKAGSLTDDFSATTIPTPAWDRAYHYGSSSYDTAGGALNLHQSDGVLGYSTASSYDVTGERIAVEITALPDPSQGQAYFRLAVGSSLIGWQMDAQTFLCNTAGQNTGTLYQGAAPELPVWVSIRESGGELFCETLDVLGGTAWKTKGSATGVLDATQVDVTIFTGRVGGSFTASFDGYNLPPVP